MLYSERSLVVYFIWDSFKVEIKAFPGSLGKAGKSKLTPHGKVVFFIDLNTRSLVWVSQIIIFMTVSHSSLSKVAFKYHDELAVTSRWGGM